MEIKMEEKESIIIEKLRSSDSSKVYDALLKIRTSYVRNQEKMKTLHRYSIIKLLIPFLEHPKFCNISLSIIADGCLELNFVNEVIKSDGVKPLMRIMKSFVNDDIQNRACRALGNIAKFDIGFKAVHLMKPISKIISFLSETKDTNCQQTAVRTLMILGKSSKTRDLIVRENGIIYIAKLLHSSNTQVLNCSTKALANLTQNCSISCARQLLDLEYHKVLIQLHSHTDKSVRNHALISLKNLSTQEEIRTGLVKVGAVKLFTEILSNREPHEIHRLAALALCKCLDHIHMWSHNGTERSVGLKALLIVLKTKEFHDIHIHVIASLIPLAYESNVSDLLLSLDVLQILLEILNLFVEKHKCKYSISHRSYVLERNEMYVDSEEADETEILHSSFYKKLENKVDHHKNYSKLPASSDRFSENSLSPKSVCKWDHSFYSFSPITSDYSGSCSPNRLSQKYCVSPDVHYDFSVGSPSTGHTSSGVWSPVSSEYENSGNEKIWSPFVSTYSDSSSINKLYCTEENEEVSLIPSCETVTSVTDQDIIVSSESNFSTLYESHAKKQAISTKNKCESYIQTSCTELPTSEMLKLNTLSKDSTKQQPSSISVVKNDDSNLRNVLGDSDFLYDDKQSKNNCNKVSVDCSGSVPLKKKMKMDIKKNDNMGSSLPLSKSSDMDSNKEVKFILDEQKSSNFRLINESSEMQTVDHYVILFMLQLSFHLEKKTNSQLADKSCFSVIIDYLCMIHNPSPKAETVLCNLIKNRYCFEKLIVNGFISELEEKMTLNYSCIHHSSIKETYSNLIIAGRQEIESNYGIGTLAHVLITSNQMGQLNAICAMTKLVTDRTSLYRLLFEANGLSLLISFVCDTNTVIQRKAMISLCELYQTLIKDQKPEKCCFQETCNIKFSTKCCYKESFLNVTFSVGGGGKILANQEKICENSDYFNALLKGYFIEKNSELVSLPEISAENLATIFHFLHGCGLKSYCLYIKRIPFSVLLELLSDCEKFLLVNVKSFVEDRLCHRMYPHTVSRIYQHSKIHNSPELSKRALQFALSIDVKQKETIWNIFQELVNLESTVNSIGDIENLLKSLIISSVKSIENQI